MQPFLFARIRGLGPQRAESVVAAVHRFVVVRGGGGRGAALGPTQSRISVHSRQHSRHNWTYQALYGRGDYGKTDSHNPRFLILCISCPEGGKEDNFVHILFVV